MDADVSSCIWAMNRLFAVPSRRIYLSNPGRSSRVAQGLTPLSPTLFGEPNPETEASSVSTRGRKRGQLAIMRGSFCGFLVDFLHKDEEYESD
jgi:hypothetical protein